MRSVKPANHLNMGSKVILPSHVFDEISGLFFVLRS